MAYKLEDDTIVDLADCPKCGATKGQPCRWMGGRAKGKACNPHPPRVQEGKRMEALKEPYPVDQREKDVADLTDAMVKVPEERFLDQRELVEYLRSCEVNQRHTSVKIPKANLKAMIAEIVENRLADNLLET